jgi:hypothetical protein
MSFWPLFAGKSEKMISIRRVTNRGRRRRRGHPCGGGSLAIPCRRHGHNGLWGYPDGAAFLESVVFESIPPSWRSSDVRDAVERVNRLAGDKRRSAAAVLADRLVVRDVPVIPYGNRVNGELFSPTVGCRVFSPVSNGVDLAVLCRSERP